jgi:hypothetical protein
VATCAAAGNYQLEPPITREQLNDPAHIGAAATVERPTRVRLMTAASVVSSRMMLLFLSHPVLKAADVIAQDRGGEASLDAYLNLPVSQYDRLDPDLIKPLGFGKYALKVPRVQVRSNFILEITKCYNHAAALLTLALLSSSLHALSHACIRYCPVVLGFSFRVHRARNLDAHICPVSYDITESYYLLKVSDSATQLKCAHAVVFGMGGTSGTCHCSLQQGQCWKVLCDNPRCQLGPLW